LQAINLLPGSFQKKKKKNLKKLQKYKKLFLKTGEFCEKVYSIEQQI